MELKEHAPLPHTKQSMRTVDLKPDSGEMLKPRETIDIVGTEMLTLHDKRVWNVLLANAHGPKLAQAQTKFSIPMSELRDSHMGNDRIADSIERLMKTIVRYRDGDRVFRFQLLGGNDMGDTGRSHGTLTYSFDEKLIAVLQNSTMFAKLKLEVVAAFSSKYALSLYEHAAQRVRMRHKFSEQYTVEEFREILGVPDNKLRAFGSLKQKAIDPAIQEINALAEFNVYVASKRTGKKITHVNASWFWKDQEGRAAAEEELSRSKIGRKARISGTSEGVVEVDMSSLPELSNDDMREIRKDLFAGADGFVK